MEEVAMDAVVKAAARFAVAEQAASSVTLGRHFGMKPAAAQHLMAELREAGVLDEDDHVQVRTQAALAELFEDIEDAKAASGA
jgi:phage terminase small subunit